LASAFIRQVMPNYHSKVKFYQDSIPLFNRYQIESQIETAFEREVKLPSGGAIVIDVTEALVSIDINSSRATKGSDIEDTATNTNLEAADEIARQLRLRDIGGLVVIDFIDMNSPKNQRAVEDRVRDALQMDRARIQVGRISRFGLLEMSRQRLRPSLGETSGHTCPRCSGQGTIRGTRSIALAILRMLEEEAQKERSSEVRAITPVPVASFLLNEKRKQISDIERRHQCRVVIVPNPDMVTPHYNIQRLRDGDSQLAQTSYEIALSDSSREEDETTQPVAAPKTAAVQILVPSTPAPQPMTEVAPTQQSTAAPATEKKAASFMARLFGKLFGDGNAATEAKTPVTDTQDNTRDRNNSQRRRGNRGGHNRNNRNRGDRDNRNNDQARRNDAPAKQQQPRAQDNNTAQQNAQQSRQRQQQQANGNRPERAPQQRPEQRPDNHVDRNSAEFEQRDNNAPARRPSGKRPRNERQRQRPDAVEQTQTSNVQRVEKTEDLFATTVPVQAPVPTEQIAPVQAPMQQQPASEIVRAAPAEIKVMPQEEPPAAPASSPVTPVAATPAEKVPEVIATPVATAAAPVAAAVAAAPAEKRQRTRPANDPRVQGKKEPREFVIVSEQPAIPVPCIPTEMAQPDPQRQQRKRPANDPRSKRVETSELA
jgi:ribonuclease E